MATALTDLEKIIPGKGLEKAVADVTTDAGRSLLRGIERTLGAATAAWTARKEAKADAIRKSIETQADIDRTVALTSARRDYELSEVEHQKNLELAKRRADRMICEMAREQVNLESITHRSLILIENEGQTAKARSFDDDWFFRFSRFAQDISDKEVQEIWAQVLKSAAIEGRQKLSVASLFQLSLMDANAADDFKRFCQAFNNFGIFATHENDNYKNSLGIDLRNLEELGLVQLGQFQRIQFHDFTYEMAGPTSPRQISLIHTAFTFTKRGAEIANAVFGSPSALSGLSAAEQAAYLRSLVTEVLEKYHQILIEPINSSRYFLIHSTAAAEPVEATIWENVLSDAQLSARVRALLDWSKNRFAVTVHDRPT